jgi:hypothetical protein
MSSNDDVRPSIDGMPIITSKIHYFKKPHDHGNLGNLQNSFEGCPMEIQ